MVDYCAFAAAAQSHKGDEMLVLQIFQLMGELGDVPCELTDLRVPCFFTLAHGSIKYDYRILIVRQNNIPFLY